MAEEVEAVDEIQAADIDLDFKPKARSEISIVELDGEILVADQVSGRYHVLNAVGSIVWQCFDGADPLSVIIDDLAAAFETPLDVVREDVLALTQSVGRVGLLEGVAPFVMPEMSMPTGIEPGVELPTFTLPDLDGALVNTRMLRGREVLFVNWSPHCGYCVKIAPELGEAQGKLAEQGVELVFVTAGDAEANRALFAENGISATVMLRGETEFDDPFEAMGTPVAYLVDNEGLVAAPLAYGAGEVPLLVARASGQTPPADVAADDHAGHDHDHEGHDHEGHDHAAEPAEGGPKYLPASGGVCGPGAGGGGKKPREWAATSGFAIGDFHVGIRANSLETDQLLRSVFSAHVLPEGTTVPENYSVVLGEEGSKTAKSLNLVLHGNATVVRSRSPRRILLGLANYLSALVEDSETPPENQINIVTVGAVIDGSAVLLPASVMNWLEKLQPRLNRTGVQLVDAPYATVDTRTCELIVREPRVEINWDALDAVAEPATKRSEPARVEPGRYPLRAWGMWNSGESDIFTRAQAVASGLGMVMGRGEGVVDVDADLTRLIDFLGRVSPIPLVYNNAESLADAVKQRVAVLV